MLLSVIICNVSVILLSFKPSLPVNICSSRQTVVQSKIIVSGGWANHGWGLISITLGSVQDP